jgi:WD40 repeat protein
MRGMQVSGVNWHPSAEDILFTCSNDHTVRVWNVKTGEQVWTSIRYIIQAGHRLYC